MNSKLSTLKATLFTFFFIFMSQFSLAEGKVKSYDIPINFNNRYVTDPEQLIVKSLTSREWEIKSSEPGKIVGWLNDYKDHEIVLAIHYDDSQISFEPISSKKLRCRKRCKVADKHYDKWRLYLRKSIALNIHTLAIKELLDQKEIRDSWFSAFKTGNVNEKIRLARNIIDLELFNPYALEVIEKEINKSFELGKLNKSQVQQYAFYCKALARTKDPKYLPILKKVATESRSGNLQRYVEKYLKTNYLL